MKTSYRRATVNDKSAIRTLLDEAHLPTESLGKNLTTFFVAEHNGAIVGVAGFEYYGEDALLRSVAIQSRLRNSGIGSGFIDWMLIRAKKTQVKRVILLTETARRFFEKKGFTVIERSVVTNAAMTNSSEFVSACPSTATTMMLNLS